MYHFILRESTSDASQVCQEVGWESQHCIFIFFLILFDFKLCFVISVTESITETEGLAEEKKNNSADSYLIYFYLS